MRRPYPGPKTRRLALQRLERYTALLRGEEHLVRRLEKLVPDAWALLEADLDVHEPREKVTLYLDRSVAKFFRAMGRGYQARVSRLLAVYAQAMIAEIRWLDEAEAREMQAVRDDELREAARPPAPPE